MPTNTEQEPEAEWPDDEERSPIDDEGESLASLILHEITEYLGGHSGLVDEIDLREIQPDLNRLARSIASQVESHFGM